jgi:hypothetical protein
MTLKYWTLSNHDHRSATGCTMTLHGKFVGRLANRPTRAGPKKYGLTTMALTFDGSDAEGVIEVHALLDPKVLDRPETSKEALKWDVGDLVQREGEVVKISKCECCGTALPVVDAFKCSRVTETA